MALDLALVLAQTCSRGMGFLLWRPEIAGSMDAPGSIVASRAARIGILVGASYGLAARVAIFAGGFRDEFAVMTIGFLFIVPLGIGYLAVRPMAAPSVPERIFAPWLACGLVILGSLATGMEGAICIVLASPAMLLLASLGGVIAASRPGRTAASLPVILVLPWAVMGVESRVALPARLVVTTSTIEIDAPASVVWPLVTSVDSIRPDERRPALFSAIGFPQPIAATLDRAGVGGVRTASFERGVVFREVVTEWQPERRIGFTIDAARVPPSALDAHVTIGGPFFDVLTGTYELSALSPSRTLLVLRSEHRVSTRFNSYAAWWAVRVMGSIQENILEVLRDRAEREANHRALRLPPYIEG